MVLRYLLVAAITAGATYGATQLLPRDPTPTNPICSFAADDGTPLAISDGPLGPRLGGIEYLAGNLTHTEKVELISSPAFDATGLVERAATDLYENRGRVARDLAGSIRQALGGGQ